MRRNATVLSVLLCASAACTQTEVGGTDGVAAEQRGLVISPSVGVDRAPTPFQLDKGLWTASNAQFVARFDGARNRISPVGYVDDVVQERAALELGTDGQPLATPKVDADGSVTTPYDGFVERWAMHDDGVEQSWDVAERPEGDELVVRVVVNGGAFVRQDSFGLHFKTTDGVELAYSDATWIDAEGHDAAITSTWAGDHIELRVPRDVLDTSTYPAVLDPTITAEVAADAAIALSPTGAQSRLNGIAFSGAQYLAVWSDNRNAASADIYGMRLDTNGAVQDSKSIAITTASGPQTNPVVAYVGSINYLVVWQDGGNLKAARVTTGGVVTQLGTIAVTAEVEQKPQIVARGTEALVVYQVGSDVKAVRYSGGAFGAPFAVATSADVESDPAVAVDPSGDYLVTFTHGASGAAPDIQGQLVTAAGALSGAAFDISAGAGGQTSSAATFAGGNFIVVWTNNSSGTKVYGTRVSTAGAVLDTHLETTLTVGGKALSASGKEGTPTVACNTGTTCLVSWRDARGTTNYDVFGRTFDTTLAPLTSDFAVSAAVRAQITPKVVAGGTDFFVAWNDDREGTGNSSAYGARVTAAGGVSDPDGILIARGNNRQTVPTVARSGGSWLVAWTDSRVRGNNVNGTRVNSTPKATDVPVLDVSNATYTQTFPTATVNAKTGVTDYFVAWSDNRAGGFSDIYATRVSATNTAATAVLDTTGIAVTTATADQERPDVASSTNGNYLIVWQDRRNGTPDIYGAIVSQAGVVGTAFAISTATGAQLTPAVAYDSTAKQFLVVWVDRRVSTTGQVWGARVSDAGAVLDPNGVQISTTNGIEPVITYGSDRFLVAWRVGDDIHAARVQTSASAVTVNDTTALTICSAIDTQSQPTLIYLDDASKHFAIAWADFRNRATTQGDIYGINIFQATGAFDGTEYVIANTTDSESRPQFSRGKIKKASTTVEALLGYQRYSSTDQNERTKMKKLVFTAL